MPEPRDRLSRPVDYAALFLNRRQHGVLLDEPDLRLSLFGSPLRRLPSAAAGNMGLVPNARGSLVRRGGFVRGNFGIGRPGSGRGQSSFRLPQGRENTPIGSARRRRGRGGTSVLPSWYPRTPLRDITAVVRAIERRRARTGEVDGREIENPTPQQVGNLNSPVPLSGAQLEHNSSMVTPGPAVGLKRSCPPSTAKVHKMLLDITKENSGEAGFLTPQKKLLNSIDKVEKVVMEELQKLKSTPSAKRAEREKKVRTLMSMR